MAKVYIVSDKVFRRLKGHSTFERFLCIFLGFTGAHRFYRGEIGMGFLYLFTLGLLGIGWIHDIFAG